MANPFHPTFGASPPLLAGRDDLIDDFAEAIAGGAGEPGRATLYTGPRGAGKTVLLNEIQDRARGAGWAVISEMGIPGFIGRLVNEQLPRLLRGRDPDAVKRRLKALNLSMGPLGSAGAQWDTVERHVVAAGLRSQVELITDLLVEQGGGLLITLDEVHQGQIAELRELAAVVQHAFRERRELAFVAAGLQSAVSAVLNDDVLTFLRRAERHHLGSVPLPDVMRAIRTPAEQAGRTVGNEALEVMAQGTRGYPFLIQLVGYNTWRLHPDEHEISLDDAYKGVTRARRRLGSMVHAPALEGTSDVDRSFLVAMAKDDGPSRMSDIQARLGVDVNYASQYRLRLIGAELIVSAGRGMVDFALPYLRERLRDEGASVFH